MPAPRLHEDLIGDRIVQLIDQGTKNEEIRIALSAELGL